MTKSDLPHSADSEDHRSNRPVTLVDVGSRDYRGEGRPCHLGGTLNCKVDSVNRVSQQIPRILCEDSQTIHAPSVHIHTKHRDYINYLTAFCANAIASAQSDFAFASSGASAITRMIGSVLLART